MGRAEEGGAEEAGAVVRERWVGHRGEVEEGEAKQAGADVR